MNERGRSRIAVIGTGGTIAFTARHPRDLYEYFDFGEMRAVGELVSAVEDLASDTDLIAIRYAELPSDAIEPRHWLELTELLHQVATQYDPLDGIVITHGTSTIEETAYFLNLAAKVSLPVALVGAQRPWNSLGSDACSNLLNAIWVASSPATRGMGVVAVHDNAIWAAREFAKVSTHAATPFDAPELGRLGYIDPDGTVLIYRSPARRHAPDTIFDTRGRKDLPRVDIVYTYAGADSAAIEAFVAAGCRGLVVAGLPPGSATPMQEAALDEAHRKGVAVVLSNRAPGGRVLTRTRLRQRGIVAADNLSPQKARILTMLALSATDDPSELQSFFSEY